MTFTCLYCLFEIHISLNILNKLIEWVFKLILLVIIYIYIYIYIERERERESRACRCVILGGMKLRGFWGEVRLVINTSWWWKDEIWIYFRYNDVCNALKERARTNVLMKPTLTSILRTLLACLPIWFFIRVYFFYSALQVHQ